MRTVLWSIVICYLCSFAAGCAADRAFSAGESYEEEGRYEEAMFSYAEAYRCDPEDSEYRVRFLSARDKAARKRYKKGVERMKKGIYASALLEFQTAYGLDPSQGIYKQMVDEAAQKKNAQQAFQEGEEFEKADKLKDAYRFYSKAVETCPEQSEYRDARKKIAKILFAKPVTGELLLASKKPFTFKLRDARLKNSFGILSQLSGITFIFDESVKDQPVSISIEKTNFHQVLDLLLSMNKLAYKTLNETTLLIYPNTAEKIKQYEEMKIRTFHLNYLDAKQAVNLVRTMLPVRKIHVNEETNSLVVRDKSEVVGVIEKLLDANDYPDAEVLLDVEVVELTDKNTRNVGLVLSRYAVDLGAFNLDSGLLLADKLSNAQQQNGTTTTEAGIANLLQVFNWNGHGGFVTVPNATYNFGKTIAKGEVLSNPKIRVKNKEKAKFNIGTRVPITTTTTNGTATGYSVNVQYVDVGVKVDAEPIIQRNNDINIKLSLEVSSIVGKEKLGDGTTTVVTIGTRNLQTVLSLKDGETSVIGGLIARTNTDSKTKLFLLGDIPLIGPLLSGNDTSKDKTELVLAITPRLVRGVTVAPNNMAAFMSGKEDHPSLQPYPAADDMDALLAEESEPQAPGINRNQVARPQAAVSPTKSVHRPTPGAPSLQHSGAMPPVPPNTPILPPRPGMSQSSAPLQPGTRRPATAQQASPRLHGAAPAAHATGIMQPVAPRTNPAQPSPIPVPTGGQDSANPAHAHITAVAPAVAMSQPSPTQQGAVQAPSPSNPGENADVPRPGANPAPAASSSTETADERR